MIQNICRQEQGHSPDDFPKSLGIREKEKKSVYLEEECTLTVDKILTYLWVYSQRAPETFKEKHKVFKEANDPMSYLKSKNVFSSWVLSSIEKV